MRVERKCIHRFFYVVIILLLTILNVYLYVSKAIPGAIESSIDLRWSRARDFTMHEWAGIEEFPSMLCCILPLALFPSIESVRIGWLIANFVFMAIIIYCLRKTFFADCKTEDFAIWMLVFSASVPVIIHFINGQNLLFSFAFFMLAYYMAGREEMAGNMAYRILAGLLLGVSFFKYSTIFFLIPIFIYKRKYVELISSVMLHVVLSIFAMFWLNISLSKLVLSPITSSVSTNTGKGFIDLMTLLNGGLWFENLLARMHGNVLYYIIAAVTFCIMLIIAIRRTDEEFKVFSLFCIMSTILIYHRQYDYLLLIIPLYYSAGKLYDAWVTGKKMSFLVYFVSCLGIMFVLMGNWIFKAIGISIEYGIGQKVYYFTSIAGIYLLGYYLLITALLKKKI